MGKQLKRPPDRSRLPPQLVLGARRNVIVGYGVAFYFLSLALKSIPVGIAYAIWAGVGIVLVATIAWIFQGQKLDGWAIVGIALIISGVAVLNLLSRSGTH